MTRDTTTDVPNVTGNQLNVAISLLQQDGFPIREVKRVERDAQQNVVLEQDPAAAPPADKASLSCAFLNFSCSKPAVTLTVSAGPGSAQVPPTAGLTREAAAEKRKQRASATSGRRRALDQRPGRRRAGRRSLQTPSAGKTAATRGSDVVLTLSTGPKLAKVPVLVGSPRSVAVQQIRSRGLVATVSEEESELGSGGPKWSVSRPSAGSEVE